MRRSRDRLLLTLEETALVLGIGRSTLYRAVKDGSVPFPVHRIGGCSYVPKVALQRFLDGEPVDCGPGSGVGVSARIYASERSSKRRPMCAAARWSSLEIGSV